MEVFHCEQGSDAWFDVKRGVVSASHFSEVLNKKTGRGLYMLKVAAEKIEGITQVAYSNENMANGIDLEPEARGLYEDSFKCHVDQVGFIKRDEWVGASPDGLIGQDGLIEIKCVLGSTHIANIRRKKILPAHIPQVQGQLLVTGRKWCDFVSYRYAMEKRPLYVIRVYRDEEYISELNTALEKFVKELKDVIREVEGNIF